MQVFFIISIGRSGTTAYARHFGLELEKNGWRWSIENIKKRIETAIKEKKQYYGEISHFHINRIPELQKAFPKAIFIHNVRNGRDVVSDFNCLLRLVEPQVYLGLDKIIPDWEKKIKFEKLCWLWAYWNKEADKYVKTLTRLEDNRYFLPMIHTCSEKQTNMKQNEPWTKEEHKIFDNICGDLMKKYGYKKEIEYNSSLL